MINKFQQGGQTQQDAIMQFVQGIAQVLQADPNDVIQMAQQNPDALEAAVQTYQQTQDINQAAQTFQDTLQNKTRAARHGAKLQYIKSLKHQCNDDEELIYFKKGGSLLDCGCVKKKENGGEVEIKQAGGVSKFKNDYSSKKVKQSQKDYEKGVADHNVRNTPTKVAVKKQTQQKLDPKTTKKLPNGKYPTNWTSQDRQTWERLHGSNDEGLGAHKNGGELKKNCGGSKMNLKKKGGEVCPKCGKVHSAGMGCAVAKFKQKFQQGGIL